MNRVARVARWSGWTIGMVILVACASRETPRPSPTPIALTPFVTLGPTATPTFSIPFPTPLSLTATPIPSPVPATSPRLQEFKDVDDRALLAALFPDLKFTESAGMFRVNDNPDWSMWINSAVEGRFTQTSVPELVVIIANDAPHISADQAKQYAPWGSFLAIFQRQRGKLQVVQRAFLFPTALSPQIFDVSIETATDFDHDSQDELLLTTTTQSLGVSTSAAFLYVWHDRAFVSVWSSVVAEDNTSALNQSEYYSIESRVEFADLDNDGMDEILVDSARVKFARDAQGLADTSQEIGRKSERRVYRWSGSAFVLDPARTTPMPK